MQAGTAEYTDANGTQTCNRCIYHCRTSSAQLRLRCDKILHCTHAAREQKPSLLHTMPSQTDRCEPHRTNIGHLVNEAIGTATPQHHRTTNHRQLNGIPCPMFLRTGTSKAAMPPTRLCHPATWLNERFKPSIRHMAAQPNAPDKRVVTHQLSGDCA